MPADVKTRARRWAAWEQPYGDFVFGRQWLMFWVELAADVARKRRMDIWRRKAK